MGWSDLLVAGDNPVLAGLPSGSHTYFVHSYHFEVADMGHRIAWVDYGNEITAISIQFHPEKSRSASLSPIGNSLTRRP